MAILLDLLVSAHAALQSGRESGDTAPADGSQADRELSICDDLRFGAVTMPGRDTIGMAGLVLSAAEDHLFCLARLLDPYVEAPLPVWGPMTMSRVAIELAARAWSLSDPTIDHIERTCRVQTELLFAAGQAQLASIKTRGGRSPENYRSSLYAWADHFNIAHGKKTLGFGCRDWWVGAPRVAPRAIISAMIEPEAVEVYQRYSAPLHGNVGALIGENAASDLPDGTRRLEIRASLNDSLDAMGWALAAWSLAIERYYRYQGWWEEGAEVHLFRAASYLAALHE